MIAISYRRDDSLPIAGRLYDRLQATFGKSNVFMDFDSIRPGLDFRSQIRDTIDRAQVVIAIIGPRWLGPETETARRIDDPNDFVRLEISHALARNIPIIPVLVNNTPMPKPEVLPEDMRAFVFRHALPLDTGLDFHQHADRMIAAITSLMPGAVADDEANPPKAPGVRGGSRRQFAVLTISAMIVAGLMAAGWFYWNRVAKNKLATSPPPAVAHGTTTASPLSRASPAAPATVTGSAAGENDYDRAMEFFAGLNGKTIDQRETIRLVTRAAEQHLPEAEARLAFWTHIGFGYLQKDDARASSLVKQALADGLEARAQTRTAAQQTLGALCEFGLVPGKAPSDAVERYQIAANKGDPIALTSLAFAYERGTGVFKDFNKAADLYQKAADQGDATAETKLGQLYERGTGVPKDLNKAAALFQKAADRGHSQAQVNLGVLYQEGTGVPKDPKKAFELYQNAATQGNAIAQNNLGWAYQNGLGVAKDLKKAVEFYQKAADQNNSRALINLAFAYDKGAGVEKSVTKSLELFQKAADQGNPDAQNDLGIRYATGNGVAKDLHRALELFQKAADQGNVHGQVSLGLCYKNGLGVPKDAGKAVELFRKPAEQGDTSAQNNLGTAYATGEGVPKDLPKAIELFQKAADRGNADAQRNLGIAYERGDAVPKDLKKAMDLYRKAAEQGNAAARASLERLQKSK